MLGIELKKRDPGAVSNAAAGKLWFLADLLGRLATVDDGGNEKVYLPSGALPYDIAGFAPGVPTASQIVVKAVAARAVTIADDFAGSRAHAEIAATASTVFDVQVNGVSVGSATFGIGATTAVFATSGGAIALAAGDRLTIIAPGTPDATLAGIAFTILGSA